MPTGLEERVAHLEREVDELKTKFVTIEQEWQNIPDLVEARLRLTDSRVSKLASDMNGLRTEVHELRVEVRELPRAIVEMLDERDRRKG
jgi:predicted RNase H-like nuclease (RuvC/YqgF family)